MTVLINKPSLNLREELAALRNQGSYSEQAFHVGKLVNGTFDTDTGWTKGSGWTISGGTAVATNVSSGIRIESSITISVAGIYTFSADIVPTASSYAIGVGTLSTGEISTTGVVTLTGYLAKGTHSVRVAAWSSGFSGTVDNISVYETDGTNAIHSLPNGWIPKDVFVDGLLKREGSGWDYTVYNDGTKNWIKPTVAPSATTTTTILGVRL